MSTAPTTLTGRLVLEDRVSGGRVAVADGQIDSVELDEGVEGPLLAPGFVDVHVHGWGGHDAMGDPAALDGMARALLARGVTSFLPTAWSTPLAVLVAFAERVRDWLPVAPRDGSQPLGFNLEGPVPLRGQARRTRSSAPSRSRRTCRWPISSRSSTACA